MTTPMNESRPPPKRRKLEAAFGSQSLLQQTIPSSSTSASRRESALRTVCSAPYWASRDLRVHTSCVNALALSKDGSMLATGGDDLRVLLHDVSALEGDFASTTSQQRPEPKAALRGNLANVFAIAFAHNNSKVFSSGVDGRIKMHDLEGHLQAGDMPSAVFGGGHSQFLSEIRHLSTHPENEHLVLAANDYYAVTLYDVRDPRRPALKLETESDVTHAEISPLPNLFLSSTSVGEIFLHDFRQCGSSQHKLLRSSPVTKYTTSLSKQSAPLLARPEATSVTFDPAGSCFTALFSKYQPTLYAVGDPLPLATLAAEGLENRCTIKHGSFGKNFKTGQLRYSCGSDDCVIRSWDLPAPETLKDARDSVTASNWTSEEPDAPKLSDLYFAQTIRGDRVRPVTLNKEAHALKGHRSIVNSVLHHPDLPLMFSSGVEKCVKVWKPSLTEPALASPRDPRPQPGRHIWPQSHSPDQPDYEEDEETLAMFDTIRSIESRRGDLFADSDDSSDDSPMF